MDCTKFQRFWHAYSWDELPPAAQTHLSMCPACATVTQGGAPTERSHQPIGDADAESAAIGLSRRVVLKVAAASVLASFISGTRRSFADGPHAASGIPVDPDAPVEYIVVGSGAGGGPLACNLARAGHKVVLFEAGGRADDVLSAPVPFFSGFTTEDERIRWDYYVRHYANTDQQTRDSKYYQNQDGVWYPRVGAVGGCTVHSFMVEIYPSDSDWNHIADLTGDFSWNADNMRRYFEEFEQCRYVSQVGMGNLSRHGFDGWQPSEMPDPTVYADDQNVLRILRATNQETHDRRFSLRKLLAGQLDPNDWRLRNHRDGIYDIPLFTSRGQRFGPREFIQQTVRSLPNNLKVMTHCLVTRVLFDGKTAVGVEYLQGEHLYRADPNPASSTPRKQTMRASREVVLAAGAFNTPQLLKLSGIGPEDELASHGIASIVNLPGVGRNLQDRYEIGVVTDFGSNFTFAAACRPGQDVDPCFSQWLNGRGPYTGYGAVGGIIRTSETQRRAGRLDPDLLISIALTRFKGYYHGYSVKDLSAEDAHHQMTWLILKGHTRNRAGTVELRSSDPQDTPVINFHYFEEGTDKKGEDLSSVVDGIEYVRRINTRLADISNGDVLPGPQAQSRDDLARFVRDEAWGHHASCTCRIGPAEDPMAVVDSKFRVHGTRNLRVVDATVFPRIPGYFILTPIYMISQKASEDMLDDVEGRAHFGAHGRELARLV